MQEATCRRPVGVLSRSIDSLRVELQGPHTVALGGDDVPSTASVLTAVELASHDEAEVKRIVQVRIGGRLQQPPVRLVNRDDLLAQRVDLVAAAESDQTLDRRLQVVANESRIVLGIDRQSSVSLEGILVVTLLQKRVQPLSNRGASPCLATAAGNVRTTQQKKTTTTRRRRSMATSVGSSILASGELSTTLLL